MSERPPGFIDFEDDESQPAVSTPIDFDEEDEEENPEEEEDGARPQADAEPSDEDEEDAGNVRNGIGRAAAVLKYIVEQIVDEPDQISIGATTDDRGPVLLLRVAEDDRGKVIGRQGRIVQAIRTIVKAASVGSGEKVGVEILD
jgi:predicted RNA-binding protein YlqC (UPF0109 family)